MGHFGLQQAMYSSALGRLSRDIPTNMAEEELANRRLNIISRHLIRASVDNVLDTDSIKSSAHSQEAIRPFQYTLNNDCLSNDQRQFYEDNGYLVVKNLVKAEELKKYAQRYDLSCDRNSYLVLLIMHTKFILTAIQL